MDLAAKRLNALYLKGAKIFHVNRQYGFAATSL